MDPLLWLMWLGYLVALLSVVTGFIWTFVLYLAGNRYLRRWARRTPGNEADYLWVFMVPALNEAVTIADSVARLRAVEATHKAIIVINDGSEDETAQVLESIAGPDLLVFTRVAPEARQGKAAALNACFHFVRSELLAQERFQGWSADRVIIGIIDADGRLAPQAPENVATHFDQPRVGGVQVNVRIYNQISYLTRMQSLEFQIFGGLYQCGRAEWGAAFMGGNGQFNRLAALESVASEEGPWSHYLTEDQELGLRLLSRGWTGEQAYGTYVDQQGLNSLRRLYRQRARWMQGNLQVLGDVRRLYAHNLTGIRRIDALITLLLPGLVLLVGVAVAVALLAAVFFGLPFLPLDAPWLLAAAILLMLGPLSAGALVVARGYGIKGLLRAAWVLPPYQIYIWLMWPVAFVGLYNLIRRKSAWAKTAREGIATTPDTP